MTFLVISTFLILTGCAAFTYHISSVLNTGHYFGFGLHALAMYPFYYLAKLGAFWMVLKFLKEIRLSPPQRRRKLKKLKKGYEQIEGSLQQLLPINETDEENVVTIEPDELKLDHQTLIRFDDHHSIIRGWLLKEGKLIYFI